MSRRGRRRKSASKAKGSRLSRWILGGLGFALLLLFGGVFFGYQAVRSYLKSDGFRVLLGELVGDAVPGKAIFQPFQWDGWSVATDGLEVKGEGAVRLLEVDDIGASVDIGAVWDGIYRIEDVIVRKVDLKGDFRGRETVVGERIEDEVVVIDGASQLKKSFWESWLPSEVEVTSLKVTSISGEAYTDRGPWSVRGASLEVLPGDGKGAYDFTIRDGNLVSPLPLVKDLTVQVAKGRYSNGSFYLLSSSTDVFERGQLSMSGEYDLKGGEWAFSGDLVGTNLGEILPEDWKQRLFGALRVDFAARGKKKGDSVVSGDLEIKNGVLTALPILDRIAAYTNTERFRRLSLSRASLAFKQQGERLELRDIILRSEGLVQIEGDLVLEAGVIRLGRFNLGITPGTLIHLPGAETKVFQRGKLGLLWAPVNIGGTLDSPTEDLSDRLIEAAGERMFELIPETGRWALKYSGQEIGSQTKDLLENHGVVLGVANSVLGNGKSLVDEGNKALNKVIEKGTEAATDAATDAAREAVGTIFDIFGRPIPKKD